MGLRKHCSVRGVCVCVWVGYMPTETPQKRQICTCKNIYSEQYASHSHLEQQRAKRAGGLLLIVEEEQRPPHGVHTLDGRLSIGCLGWGMGMGGRGGQSVVWSD